MARTARMSDADLIAAISNLIDSKIAAALPTTSAKTTAPAKTQNAAPAPKADAPATNDGPFFRDAVIRQPGKYGVLIEGHDKWFTVGPKNHETTGPIFEGLAKGTHIRMQTLVNNGRRVLAVQVLSEAAQAASAPASKNAPKSEAASQDAKEQKTAPESTSNGHKGVPCPFCNGPWHGKLDRDLIGLECASYQFARESGMTRDMGSMAFLSAYMTWLNSAVRTVYAYNGNGSRPFGGVDAAPIENAAIVKAVEAVGAPKRRGNTRKCQEAGCRSFACKDVNFCRKHLDTEALAQEIETDGAPVETVARRHCAWSSCSALFDVEPGIERIYCHACVKKMIAGELPATPGQHHQNPPVETEAAVEPFAPVEPSAPEWTQPESGNYEAVLNRANKANTRFELRGEPFDKPYDAGMWVQPLTTAILQQMQGIALGSRIKFRLMGQYIDRVRVVTAGAKADAPGVESPGVKNVRGGEVYTKPPVPARPRRDDPAKDRRAALRKARNKAAKAA